MASFQDFLTALEGAVKQLAAKEWSSFAGAATKDGQAFVAKVRDNLRKWTAQLAGGKLSKEDFEDLVRGEQDLAELTALKDAGLLEAKLQQFQSDLLNTVVATAVKVFL